MISTNIAIINKQVQEACNKVDRTSSEVNLVAVSKNKSVDEIMVAHQTGQRIFGENRVQELMKKFPMVPNDIEWHLIGHLQTNKVKYIIDKVALIHSLDSFKLAEEINKRAELIGRQIAVLIQVNVAKEDTKFGLEKNQVIDFLEEVKDLSFLKVKGLMTIAPEVDKPEEVRPVFRELKNLFRQIDEMKIPSIEMQQLSMGMTGDFQIAVEEGATLIRVGSGVFGERQY